MRITLILLPFYSWIQSLLIMTVAEANMYKQLWEAVEPLTFRLDNPMI